MLSESHNCLISAYYRRLIDSLGPGHPLRRTVFPLNDRTPVYGERLDPLGERNHMLCPGLIHTYPDKVLFLATLNCAVHCQYCTRSRLVNRDASDAGEPLSDWKQPFRILEKLTQVRDVLISGGDPLMLPDDRLAALFCGLRQIGHVRTVRLGTKMPAVMPDRITPDLAVLLAAHRVWLQLHFIHPAEMTEEAIRSLDTLADAGVPMVSQTVLLKGINDDADLLADLFYTLLENRVKPYYLFQCDPVTGSAGFRTAVQDGLDLMRQLQGRVSGLALPDFCIDAPGGGGKITLSPNTVLRRNGDDILLTGYDGREYRYPDKRK